MTAQNFRTAFNGFHREDVVQYIEALNGQHKREVNGLREEIIALREELQVCHGKETLQQELDDSREESEHLRGEIQELTSSYESMIAQLEEKLKNQDEELHRQNRSEELEMYRRAEAAERQAKERSERMLQNAASEITKLQDQFLVRSNKLTEASAAADDALETLKALLEAGKQETASMLSSVMKLSE